jgi:hypothetical protein
MTFGSGGVDDAEDAEIIWHEYGHAMLDNQVPGMNQNFEGMGEGWGDYWAATNAARHPSLDHAQYDPAIGEWDAVSYNPGNPPYLRRVDTKARYPEGRRFDPHATGQIWSGACWDIHTAIGRVAADHIFIEGNFLMPMAPTLPEAARAMLQADRDLNDGAHQAAMTLAFQARGLMAAPLPPTITLTLPNGGEVLRLNSDVMLQWSSTGNIENVKIEFSRDDGATYQELVNSTPNDGVETWKVARWPTRRARIRISDVSDPEIHDTSDEPFQIRLL